MNLTYADQFTSFIFYFDKILMQFEDMIKKLFAKMNYQDMSETQNIKLFVFYHRESFISPI